MNPRRKHHDLIVWQQGIVLVKTIYKLTASFPESERFGLSSQMRRAAVSIPANIAEGVSRNSFRDRIYFLSIARSSLNELETHAILARELGFASDVKELLDLLDREFALITGLMNSERRKGASK
jgi:four helix bundle protein